MATLGFCFALKLSTKHQRRKDAKGVRAHEGRTDCRRFGWLVSLTLHCGALALALHGMSELRMREKPHVFQWDVLLATVTPGADPIPASVVEKQALSPSATSPQSAPPRKETTASSVQPGIIDRAPIDGLFLNTGWCYGGFKATPASGWCFAHLLATGVPHPHAASFRLDRFATGHLIDEKGQGAQPNLH